MQWNQKHIELLKSWGYSDEDIKQIKYSGKYLKLRDITLPLVIKELEEFEKSCYIRWHKDNS